MTRATVLLPFTNQVPITAVAPDQPGSMSPLSRSKGRRLFVHRAVAVGNQNPAMAANWLA